MSIKKIIRRAETLKSDVEKQENMAEKIIGSCHHVGKSWSGSSMVGHAKFYYKDFEEPDSYNRFNIEWGLIHGIPEGWEEKSGDTVREKIESTSHSDLEKFRALVTKFEQGFDDLRRDAVLALSDSGFFETDKIENFSFKSATDHFNLIFPTKFMTRDTGAMTGHYIVPHIYYESIAKFVRTFPDDLKNFIFEIKKIVKNTKTEKTKVSGENKTGYYVENSTIIRLSKIESKNYDLSKLVKLCQELNDGYSLENYLTCGMLIRSILDHIPPIFGKKTFEEVSSNYGTKSFKDIIKPLQESSKKIADSYLHTQIRKKEILPTKTQISFQPNLDFLLNEIVRILNENSKKI